MTGEISWYNDKLGFGFITPTAGGNRCYFETTQRELFSVGQTVEYETQENPKNGRVLAVHVKAVKAADTKAPSD